MKTAALFVVIALTAAACGLSLELDFESSSSDATTVTPAIETDSDRTAARDEAGETVTTDATPATTTSPSTTSAPLTTTTTEAQFLPVPEPSTEAPDGAGQWGSVVVSVESFWTENFGAFAGSGSYDPPDRDRIVGVSDDESDLPSCERANLSTRSVEDNAFAAVCPEGQLVVWDEDDLFVELVRDYGDTGPAIVIAHEFGHVVQFQAGVLRRTAPIIVEQQADCMAGAYASWARERGIAPFDAAESLDAAVGATVSFRDRPGANVNASGAHGSGFDRVRAFQDGFDRGAEFCARYRDTPPSLTEIPFTSTDDFNRAGNLPFIDLVDLVVPYFEDFFAAKIPQWEAFSPTAEDLAPLEREHRIVGDNSSGTLIALRYGAVAQELLGLESVGEGPLLQQACVAGGLFEPLFFPRDNSPEGVSLSPGDLDEAVLALSRLVERSGEFEDGYLFELVASLRLGFFQGFEACTLV